MTSIIRLGEEANLYLELTPIVSRPIPTVGVKWVVANRNVPLWYSEYSVYNMLGVFGSLEAIFTRSIAPGAVTLRDESNRIVMMSTEFLDGLTVYVGEDESRLTIETPTETLSLVVDLQILRTIIDSLEGLMSDLYPSEGR